MSETCPVFLQTAEEFCYVIERSDAYDRAQFAARCFQLVSKLLTQVSVLPDTPLLTETHQIPTEEYNEIVRRLKNVLGDKDDYRMVFDPYVHDETVISGSLSDDLADIWRDIKAGLEAFRTGGIEEAVGEWRFSFVFHWGAHHATHTLRPLLSVMLDSGWYGHEE